MKYYTVWFSVIFFYNELQDKQQLGLNYVLLSFCFPFFKWLVIDHDSETILLTHLSKDIASSLVELTNDSVAGLRFPSSLFQHHTHGIPLSVLSCS